MYRLLFAGFTIFALAVAARAEEAPPARFFIEKIEVRNVKRVSPQLVTAESLLREGAEYSEDELRAAAARLSRLPFLLSADFALEKGSERGRYLLAINVVETKPFFYYIDARPTLLDESRNPIDYELDPVDEAKDAALGFRWFLGGRGVVHVGLTSRRDRQTFTSDYSAWAIGYTRYDILGTRAFATLNLRLPFDSPAEGLVSPQLVAGVPLTANQTLTLDYEDTFFRRDQVRVRGTEFHQQDAERLVSLAWTYNSTNQPFVPTRGTIVRVAPLRSMRDRAGYRFVNPIPGPGPDPYTEHMNGYGLDFTALHYWELSELDSFSAGLIAGWGNVDDRLNPRLSSNVRYRPAYQTVRGGWSRNLRHDDSKNGDSRLELDVRVVKRQRNVQEGRGAFGETPDEERSRQTSISWVRRSLWGTLRLGVGYAWGY
jgi:outer membrane protein assembly factor BamA